MALVLGGCLSEPDQSPRQEGGKTVNAASTAGTLHPLGAKRKSKAFLDSKRVSMIKPGAAVTAFPASLDYSSKFPAPGNQGSEGSCVGWAAGYGVKSFLETTEEGWNTSSALHRFSPSWIYNQINNGVDNGSYVEDAFTLIVNRGADAIAFFPYADGQYTTQPDFYSMSRTDRYHSDSWVVLAKTVADVKAALNAKLGVVITFAVYPDWDGLSSTNSIYDNTSGFSRGLHANAVIGYDDAKQAFKTLNSWGTGWGLSGYGWIAYSMLNDPNASIELFALTDAPNFKRWDPDYHPRTLADINGDGKKDLVGFGMDGVYAALSTGSAFGAPKLWRNEDFGTEQQWDLNTPRSVKDVNGDGKADVIGFGINDVWVSLSNGSSFGSLQRWSTSFQFNSGWDAGTTRLVADMNGDGKGDIVGFGHDGVYVALSSGSKFNAPVRWSTQFNDASGAHAAGNQLTAYDVNGDKKADVVYFGPKGTTVALSTGSGIGTGKIWTADFDTPHYGAQTNRILGDVNGDGKADVIGITFDNTYVAPFLRIRIQRQGPLVGQLRPERRVRLPVRQDGRRYLRRRKSRSRMHQIDRRSRGQVFRHGLWVGRRLAQEKLLGQHQRVVRALRTDS